MSENTIPKLIRIPHEKMDAEIKDFLGSEMIFRLMSKNRYLGPVIALLFAVASMIFFLYLTLSRQSYREPEIAHSVLSAISLAGIVAAVFWIRSRRRLPFDLFTAIHPLFLIQSRVGYVNLVPLMEIADLSLTQHLKNGSYQHTEFAFSLNDVPYSYHIRPHSVAEESARKLVAYHGLFMEKFAGDTIELSEGMEILLNSAQYIAAGTGDAPSNPLASGKWIVPAVLTAIAVISAVSLHLYASRQHNNHYAEGCASGHLSDCSTYLRKEPRGSAAETVKAHRQAILGQGLSIFDTASTLPANTGARKAVAAIGNFLTESGRSSVPLRFTQSYRNVSDERLEKLGFKSTDGVFEGTSLQGNAQWLLQDTLEKLTQLSISTETLEANATVRYPVEFHVSIAITGRTDEGYLSQRSGDKICSIRIHWIVKVVNGETGETYHKFATVTAPADKIAWTTSRHEWSQNRAYEELAKSALVRTKRGFIKSFGIDSGSMEKSMEEILNIR